MKRLFKPQIDDTQYINSTHKLNLTGGEISTILYYLDQVTNILLGALAREEGITPEVYELETNILVEQTYFNS